jgi:hypothetical protein
MRCVGWSSGVPLTAFGDGLTVAGGGIAGVAAAGAVTSRGVFGTPPTDAAAFDSAVVLLTGVDETDGAVVGGAVAGDAVATIVVRSEDAGFTGGADPPVASDDITGAGTAGAGIATIGAISVLTREGDAGADVWSVIGDAEAVVETGVAPAAASDDPQCGQNFAVALMARPQVEHARVTVLLSRGVAVGGGAWPATGEAIVVDDAAAPAVACDDPQSGQNVAVAAMSRPQSVHGRLPMFFGCAVAAGVMLEPHARQNRAPAGFSTLQVGHAGIMHLAGGYRLTSRFRCWGAAR